ncbi:hypothetical protein [Duganella lactea]|uniref:hypothetical protein n=1 Tax=Duganella lactea TaxID=2692173 RepID=UPI0019282404|nr:hypothetical protein [Duganella lactea]
MPTDLRCLSYKELWRGESVSFSGAGGKDYPITVYPRPHQETAGMRDGRSLTGAEKEKIVDYAFQRYFGTAAMFGNVEQASAIVDKAIQAGVNDIACLVDFGMDYDTVRDSLPYLQQLVKRFRPTSV